MSMPPPRFLGIGVGCVVKYSQSIPNVTIGATVSDIKSLHTYFTSASLVAPSIADEIFGYLGSDIDPGPSSGDIVFTNHYVKVPKGKYKIHILGPSLSAVPSTTSKSNEEMKDGYCYWLVPVKKKKKATAKKAKKKYSK